MHTLIDRNNEAIQALCARYDVQRLSLFGSITDDRFDSVESDIDILVEFGPMAPVAHADSYFGLMEALEDLFNKPVDLVELGPITNPYFRQSIEETQVVVYEAA